eukprot:11160102-Lingulodinium_polyedra.AAC.1
MQISAQIRSLHAPLSALPTLFEHRCSTTRQKQCRTGGDGKKPLHGTIFNQWGRGWGKTLPNQSLQLTAT